METLIQDIRFGIRRLLKSKGFALIAVLSLALGIGANTAIFSLVNTVLFKSFPIENADEVYSVTVKGKAGSLLAFSGPNYKDFRDRNEVLSGMLVQRFSPVNLSRNGSNERAWGFLVSGNYFETLGVKAAVGRTFTQAEDNTKLSNPVIVISYDTWQKRFGGESSVIGQDVIVNNRSFKVIGVAPKNFRGLELLYEPEFWAPLLMQEWIEPRGNWLDERDNGMLFAYGRLKPGVTKAQAEASLNLLAEQIGKEHPDSDGMKVELLPPGFILPDARSGTIAFSLVLMATVSLVLLIACTNLASLLLARAAERRKEIAVRLSMGASRIRLIRQLLTESVLLALVGGVLGVLLAVWLLELLVAFKPPVSLPINLSLQLDWRVMIFALLVSLLTGIVFGLAPALQSSKPDLVSALKDTASQSGSRRSYLRSGLVVAQIALSLVLLIAAGLVLRTLQKMQTLDPGFNPENMMTLTFDLDLQGYDENRNRQFQKQLLERLHALPGVKSAALTNFVPLSLNYSSTSVYIEGQPPARGTEVPLVMYANVTPRYFETLQTPVLAGREFNERDNKDAPRAVIVNESFIRKFMPGLNSIEEAIGRRYSRNSAEGPFYQIVGVARDGKYFTVGEAQKPFVWFSMLQLNEGYLNLLVRTNGDAKNSFGAIRAEFQKLDANLPLTDVKTMTEHLSLTLFAARIGAAVLGSFGALALALAAIGIYGVTAYSVAQRTREIGIRMAIGASPMDVLKMIVSQGLNLALIGLVTGLVAAFALSRLMSSVLYGVSATDIVTFVVVPLLLLLIVLLACYVPARRAMKVDPMIALRYE